MEAFPSGTVSFLFTDIEGSTKRWENWPEEMSAALARHDGILRASIETCGGSIFKTGGDAFYAAFASPLDAVGAALAIQRAIGAEPWDGAIGEMRVRIAVHTGIVEMRDGDYFGQPLNRVARLLSAGHGGQILVSHTAEELVRDRLPEGIGLSDLGEHRLKDLVRPERIYQVLAPDLPSSFPTLKTLDANPNNLPHQASPLIGREAELASLCTLLKRDDVSLATLTGPGGTGKTRLALQAGAELLGSGTDGEGRSFPDGVWIAELAPLSNHALVLPTIAKVFEVAEAPGEPLVETLKGALKEKRLLLIADNFEQLLPAAPAIAELLAACPGLTVLATSRAPLRIRGEHEYPVPPLSVPDRKDHPSPERLSQYDSVRLFIERAVEIKPDFAMTNENAPAVAEICARLDGLPLALELAAARVRLFTPQTLLGKLGNRLNALTGGGRDLPERQRTLRNAIEWSYGILSEDERLLFRRMAVFQGGRTIEALEAVCAADGKLGIEIMEGIEALVEGSLLKQRDGADGEPRFWFLETIHDFAREKLAGSGEEAELRQIHARYFMELAEKAELELTGADQAVWLNRLEEEHDNFRTALAWARECGAAGDAKAAEIGIRIAGSIWRFWYIRGYLGEGREWLAVLIAPLGASEPGLETFRAKALNGLGNLAYYLGDYPTALTAHTEALGLRRKAGDRNGVAATLNNLGLVHSSIGEKREAKELYSESIALSWELGERKALANALSNLGIVIEEMGEYPAAREYYSESIAIRRELGDRWGLSIAMNNLASIEEAMGRYSEAGTLYEEVLVLAREMGDREGIALELQNLGSLALRDNDVRQARKLEEESLAIYREIGMAKGTGETLDQLAAVSYMEGEMKAARERVDEGINILRKAGNSFIYTLFATRGHIALREGDYAGARSDYAQCLSEKRDSCGKSTMAAALVGMAGIAAATGRFRKGAVLLGAATAFLAALGYAPKPVEKWVLEESTARAKAGLSPDEFGKAFAEGEAMSIEEAITLALGPET